MSHADPRLTGGCGLLARDPYSDAPVRICIAPHDHVAHGLPHKWVRYDEWCELENPSSR